MKNNLRELRKSHQLTQEKLSELTGVSRQTIISIETGRFDPSIKLAYKLAKVFDLAIEDLFLFEEDM
ncbi:helix-turn-helix transcriptional regulator [Peribacillus sp. NPDC097675]|uniref:helix-turn-helix transcriptional regulator n=1 Tax=Peribacillus sp. NPDC097675 TaxID=3390618 RepID=UPI003CFDF8BB